MSRDCAWCVSGRPVKLVPKTGWLCAGCLAQLAEEQHSVAACQEEDCSFCREWYAQQDMEHALDDGMVGR